ncbi:hypothetical protein [Vacuolonema iberomarrocanum]|uniref:hypothetical protein n=1 Tax=Vacuolonema iberomarrocanum TaxID=3454632 RepID=UPI001A03F557|nr:hypothetical protein [filamentous cyanobacterium LEGE 07170]
MTQTTSSTSTFMTMEDYLAYNDGTDTRYELVDGELVKLLIESQVNLNIAKYLLFELSQPSFLVFG